MPIDILLDANIPKRVKRLNNGWRVLHIGDVDTDMKDDDILHLLSRLRCMFVTHDRNLALKVSKRYKTLFIKENVGGEDIASCLMKNKGLLKTASIFCESERKCKNCRN